MKCVVIGTFLGTCCYLADEPKKPDNPRVQFTTNVGSFTIELDAVAAPKTAANFLKYVDKKLYDGGSFHRTVTMENQPDNKVKIEVVQGAADPKREKEFLQEIPLERTRETKMKHLVGTISMARDLPDTAKDEFFICLSDQPELDFGGKRNPDGQGFAAFGRVVEGMETLKKIHRSKSKEQRLTPKIEIRSAKRVR